MTAFLQCFGVLSQIGFASNRNLLSSFGKASQPFCTEMSWANLRCFSKNWKYGTWFPDFSDFRPNKMCFGARWRFCPFFTSNIWPSCLPYWKCSTNYLWCSTKVERTYLPSIWQLIYFYDKKWLWLIGFALVYCVGVNERENQISHIEMFQSNIYYYERIKWYIVSIQELCLQKTYQDVPRKKWKTCHKS